MNARPRLILIGGTERALQTFRSILDRENVEVILCIFMKGSAEEQEAARKLSKLASTEKIENVICDKLSDALITKCENLNADAIIGIGIWRTLLVKRFFNSARCGYLSLHGTGLPDLRGFAGINWQIMLGYDEIRMRAFRLASGVDDGDLILRKNGEFLEYKIDLNNEKHLLEIFEEYEQLHIKATNEIIDLLSNESLIFEKQDEDDATYGCHFSNDDAEVDWEKCSSVILNLIRSQSYPYRGAWTYYNSKRYHIQKASIEPAFTNYKGRIPGKVVEINKEDDSVVILTKDSAVRVYSITTADGLKVKTTSAMKSKKTRCKSRVESYMDYIGF